MTPSEAKERRLRLGLSLRALYQEQLGMTPQAGSKFENWRLGQSRPVSPATEERISKALDRLEQEREGLERELGVKVLELTADLLDDVFLGWKGCLNGTVGNLLANLFQDPTCRIGLLWVGERVHF